MTFLMDLPLELLAQVLSDLSSADLGNLAMTCRQLRDWLDPKLAARLKRLVWANPNIVQLIRPQHPENYGITQKDMLASDSLPDAKAHAVRDNLRRFTEDLYACPMLAKYVKHVFIDYRTLSGANGGPCWRESVEQVIQILRSDALEKYANNGQAHGVGMSLCVLAAMLLLKFTSAESLVLVGCNCYDFEICEDLITAVLSVALTPRCQQKWLRGLEYVYAWGCLGRWQSEETGYAPWNFAVLPSVKTLECQEARTSLSPRHYGESDNFILRRALECDPVLHLEALVIRQEGLTKESFYKILKHTPYLKRLSYQCISFKGRIHDSLQGLQLAKLRCALQSVSHCLEDLTIEVEAMQDLWGFNYLNTDHNIVDTESDGENSAYNDSVDDDDSEDEDDRQDDDNSDDEEIDWKNELKSLDLTRESEQLNRLHGQYHDLWTVQGILNIPNVAPEDIQASLDRLSGSSDISEPWWDDQQPEFLGSLAHFTKLRNLAVPAMVLQDPWPYPGHGQQVSATVYSNGTALAAARKHLKDLLPRSIERLTLFKLKDHLPNLEQDIRDVLETQAFNFPNLLSLEEKDTPICRASADEERLWDNTLWTSYGYS